MANTLFHVFCACSLLVHKTGTMWVDANRGFKDEVVLQQPIFTERARRKPQPPLAPHYSRTPDSTHPPMASRSSMLLKPPHRAPNVRWPETAGRVAGLC